MHYCPRCGDLTSGAWTEGGTKLSICEDCYQQEIEQEVPQCMNCGAKTTYTRSRCNLCYDEYEGEIYSK